MSKLIWDAVGTHEFETGVDHGVLYPLSASSGSDSNVYGPGVVWNGLSKVSQSPEGAEPTTIYADNIEYLNILSAEKFKATIEAYTYPDEFAECDGSAELIEGSGVSIDQQVRKPFCLSYRTKVGTDVNPDAGYKIHIIYGALAKPSSRDYETINDSPAALTMSWELSTTPVTVAGFKPTAHLVIDSTKVEATKLASIEAALYGSEEAASKVLLPDEIAALLA